MQDQVKRVVAKPTEETMDVNQNICGDPGTIVLLVIGILDTILLLVLFIDGTINCEGYLRTWVVGTIFLSTFFLSFVKRVKKIVKDEKGFFFEVFLMLLCFLWIYYGTVQINKSSACQKTAPFIFWTVFSFVTTTWCSIIGMILSLMVITIGSFFVARTKVNEE